MPSIDRRTLLAAAAAALPAIARARAIDAHVKTGTIKDVEHVVILMQENRGFDHYFGSMAGVRGFGDRFPIPVARPAGAPRATVWRQQYKGKPAEIAPFHLDTVQAFPVMRVEGAPHTWPDAQAAWNEGRIDRWPDAKTPHAMGYYRQADLPFQFALADAFTVCDAYHCSMQTGTNTNRLFLWTGTNDPEGKGGGPAIGNSHENFATLGGAKDDYHWTTYPERLQAAGVDWRIYQDMADNFTDNPLAGFKAYREAHAGAPGHSAALKDRAVSTRDLSVLKADVLAGRLPQVAWIISGAKDSEHPGPSSPAQGADYTARVLDALTADPKVWSRTVLLVMFDENDGFFDHMPPPAPPSRDPDRPGGYLGGSTVDTTGEYHLKPAPDEKPFDRPELVGRPYGLGPRAPMYVISPWSRGGWVNSEVFDHTSVIRFLETRFGVKEPNITPWRRAVCGDLSSAFDFRNPNGTLLPHPLPPTAATAARAAALPGRTTPPTPDTPTAPEQLRGTRPSRPLTYALEIDAKADAGRMRLVFRNTGRAGAVFHVYDRLALERPPRRFTVEPGKSLTDTWSGEAYDLWVVGPNGFHRAFASRGAPDVEPMLNVDRSGQVGLRLLGRKPGSFTVTPNAYGQAHRPWTVALAPGADRHHAWPLAATGGWYDLTLTHDGDPGFRYRFAGRVETGRPSISDPAMGGPALMTWA